MNSTRADRDQEGAEQDQVGTRIVSLVAATAAATASHNSGPAIRVMSHMRRGSRAGSMTAWSA